MNLIGKWINLTLILSFLSLISCDSSSLKKTAPPRAVATSHQLLFMGEEIEQGELIWEGISSSFAEIKIPADWLRLEARFLLNFWAERDFSRQYQQLDLEQQKSLQLKLIAEYESSTIDEDGRLLLSAQRAQAVRVVEKDFRLLLQQQKKIILDEDKIKKIMSYFFWESWLLSSQRPQGDYGQ